MCQCWRLKPKNCSSSCIGPMTGSQLGISSQDGPDARTWVILQRFSGHYAALVLGLIPACSVVGFPLSSRLFLPLAGLFSLLRRGPVFAPGIKFPGASDGGYVRGPENLYLRGRFRVLLISGVFPYLCRYENG